MTHRVVASPIINRQRGGIRNIDYADTNVVLDCRGSLTLSLFRVNKGLVIYH